MHLASDYGQSLNLTKETVNFYTSNILAQISQWAKLYNITMPCLALSEWQGHKKVKANSVSILHFLPIHLLRLIPPHKATSGLKSVTKSFNSANIFIS